jgi:hypothetical protein
MKSGAEGAGVGAAGGGGSAPSPALCLAMAPLGSGGLPSEQHDWGRRLLQLKQLSEQDWFVTTRARASQPQGMAKESALLATPLAEAALATLATLVQGVGD